MLQSTDTEVDHVEGVNDADQPPMNMPDPSKLKNRATLPPRSIYI